MRNMAIFLILYAVIIIAVCTGINAIFIHPTAITIVTLQTPSPIAIPQPTPKQIHIGSTIEEVREIFGEPKDISSWYPGKCYDYDGCNIYTDKDNKVKGWYADEKVGIKFKSYN